MKKLKKIDFMLLVERILFSSKWLLIIFYFGLIIALINFIKTDAREVYHFLTSGDDSKSGSMMFILELIDMTMVAALVIMIVKGGYTSFVCKNHSDDGEKTSSGVLKVKLGTAIIGVSSINLLQTFMSASSISWDTIYKLILIHSMFLIGGLVLAVIDYLHVKSEDIHHDDWDKNGLKGDENLKGAGHFKSDVCDTKKELLTEEKQKGQN